MGHVSIALGSPEIIKYLTLSNNALLVIIPREKMWRWKEGSELGSWQWRDGNR